MSKVLKAREEERHANSKTSPAVMTLISVPLGGDLVHAFVVVVILAVFSQYYDQLLTPAILFTTLISVDIQTDAINVRALAAPNDLIRHWPGSGVLIVFFL